MRKVLLANLTAKLFDAVIMNIFSMICKVFSSSERFTTNLALKRLFATVSMNMNLEMLIPCKSFTAYLTLERFISAMNTQMDLQILFNRKALVANLTFEWFYSSVYNSLMLFQVPSVNTTQLDTICTCSCCYTP